MLDSRVIVHAVHLPWMVDGQMAEKPKVKETTDAENEIKVGDRQKNTIKEYDEKEDPEKIRADDGRDAHRGCVGEVQESGDR